jgi:hypothetical protein
MAYEYTLGPNMAGAKSAVGYDPNIIKLVGNSWVAPNQGYGGFRWVHNVLTVARGMPNGLPEFVAVAPYTLHYLGNFDTHSSSVAGTALRSWTSGRKMRTSIQSLLRPPTASRCTSTSSMSKPTSGYSDACAESLRETIRYRALSPLQYAAGSLRSTFTGRRTTTRRILIASDNLAVTSEEQFAPLLAGRNRTFDEIGVLFDHRLLDDVLASPPNPKSYAAVLAKLSFLTPKTEALDKIARLRRLFPHPVRLIYFDGDDDSCMARAGHCSPKMTAHYTHISMQAERMAMQSMNRKPVISVAAIATRRALSGY